MAAKEKVAPTAPDVRRSLDEPTMWGQMIPTRCDRCDKLMNPAESMLGPTCGKCCRAIHRAVAS